MADASTLPLTAEQVVRGLGFALTQLVNAQRHPSEAIREDGLTMALGAFMGVRLTTDTAPEPRDITGRPTTRTREVLADLSLSERESRTPRQTVEGSPSPSIVPQDHGAADA